MGLVQQVLLNPATKHLSHAPFVPHSPLAVKPLYWIEERIRERIFAAFASFA
jgi:hypothetical protein